MGELIYVLIYVLFVVSILFGIWFWVYNDAKKIGLKKENLTGWKGLFDLSPKGWAWGVTLWFGIFLWAYLIKRYYHLKDKKSDKVILNKCPFCLSEINKNSLICPKCGKELSQGWRDGKIKFIQ